MAIKHQLFFEYSFNQHMKRQILRGEGIQGMCLTLSVCDMFTANQAVNELKTVLDNHKKIEEYKTAPYDKRKDLYPEGEPKRVELSENMLKNLCQLMLKLSFEAKSTLFDANDEEEEKESAESDAVPTNDKFCVQLVKVGPIKLQVVKDIKEFTGMCLKEAKELADAAETQTSTIVAKDLSFFEASQLKTSLLESGATAAVLSQSVIPQF